MKSAYNILNITYGHYPFGMQMEGRKSVSQDYRYGFNGQEKEPEITNNNSHTSAEYWMYDSRLGRRWNVDPVVKHYESPYTTLSDNPIIMRDLKGDDDVIVNKDGKVIKITKNENKWTLQHNNGKADDDFSELREIKLNDSKLDESQLMTAEIGDQLVHFVDYTEANFILEYQGVKQTDIAVPNAILLNRGGRLDFGFSYLRKRMLENFAIEGDYQGVHHLDAYSIWDGKGGFFVFTGQTDGNGGFLNIAYNLPDAGNYLFGLSLARMGSSWLAVMFGTSVADPNDPVADRTAIYNGFNYHADIVAYHYNTNLVPQFTGWETSQPDFHNPLPYIMLVAANIIEPYDSDSKR